MKQNIVILALSFVLLIGCKKEQYELYSLEYSSNPNMEFCRILIKDNKVIFLYEQGTSGQAWPISDNNQISVNRDIHNLNKTRDDKLEISNSNEVAKFKRVKMGSQKYSFKIDSGYLIDKYSYLISNGNLNDYQIKDLQIEFATKVLINYIDIDLIEEVEPEVFYNPK